MTFGENWMMSNVFIFIIVNNFTSSTSCVYVRHNFTLFWWNFKRIFNLTFTIISNLSFQSLIKCAIIVLNSAIEMSVVLNASSVKVFIKVHKIVFNFSRKNNHARDFISYEQNFFYSYKIVVIFANATKSRIQFGIASKFPKRFMWILHYFV